MAVRLNLHLLQSTWMPGKEQRPIGNEHIPGWAERERSGDFQWIGANMHVLWPAAQKAFTSAGRGALVVDLTTLLGTGHPFLYSPKADIGQDADALRMVNQYNPKRELVIMLLKADERSSTY
jgi:hypothetical protein